MGEKYFLGIAQSIAGSDIYIQEHSHYGDPSKIDKLVEELKKIAAKIVPRNPDTLPNEAGVCVDGAFVLDSGNPHHERTTVGVRLPESDDVHFSVDMTLKDRLYEDDALEYQLKIGEQEANQNGLGDWYSRIKFLRRKERRISDWNGYEALVRRPPQKQFRSVHEFSFVSQGEPNNFMLPMITLDLHTGIQRNTMGLGMPSLNDDEIIEVWDRLTQSIRPIVTKQNSR
ncbi:T6SS immunity protein Tli4 family protein [Pseudoduganella sp. HUAS MS19]